MAGAQAADLPVKAKPVQYVKICSLYGAGFWYIPGTDTCIKLGGWVRTEYNINSGGSFNPTKSSQFDRSNAGNTIRNRGIMTWDVREQTEYGTLRAYIGGGWQNTNGDYASNAIYAPRAFIQFAGFILGKATSYYDFYITPRYSNTTNVWGSDSGGGGDIVWGYTAQFGGGLSASLALEDPLRTQKGIGGSSYVGGPQLPDLTANLHLDAAWGSAQIMGALHQVAAVGTNSKGIHPDDEVGWSIGGGALVKLDAISKGDNISAEVDYSQGAIAYTGSGIGSFLWCHHHGATCGFGTAVDATWVGSGSGTLELTTAWSVVAGFEHHWSPHWRTSIYGTYGEISYPSSVCSAGLCDWNFGQVGSRTIWSPVKNLDLSVDVMYNHLGTAAFGSDQSVWQAILRAQRNFYP
jgi:Porin subfamily